VSAFQNSFQRNDPPKCHPNTRVQILRTIFDWIVHSNLERYERILWLNGAAGAGKSAIMQSLMELCLEASIGFAAFFFFRSEISRNNTKGLFATLAYQLAQAIPDALDGILGIIDQNPLIFEENLESQLHQLVIQPLLQLTGQFLIPFVIFVDGLDECNDRSHQSTLIKLFSSITEDRTIPIIFVIASRREPEIEASFSQITDSHILRTISLDYSDVSQTYDDIRRYLVDKFTEIKKTHIRRHLIPSAWPPIWMIDEIVAKSSGQFIYASIVI
ncbi:hypothetical protein BDN70DRAFT_776594, partial [Pholiota conissans]